MPRPEKAAPLLDSGETAAGLACAAGAYDSREELDEDDVEARSARRGRDCASEVAASETIIAPKREERQRLVTGFP